MQDCGKLDLEELLLVLFYKMLGDYNTFSMENKYYKELRLTLVFLVQLELLERKDLEDQNPDNFLKYKMGCTKMFLCRRLDVPDLHR
jgi:hypothetical protein